VSRQAADVQARSALTGTGFTTSEAEPVVNHAARRRIVLQLMLLGSIGAADTSGCRRWRLVRARWSTLNA